MPIHTDQSQVAILFQFGQLDVVKIMIWFDLSNMFVF